jgi:hypothetical protein
VSTCDLIPPPPDRAFTFPKADKYEAIPDPDVGVEVAPEDTLSKYDLTAGAAGAAVAPELMASKYDFTADAEPWIAVLEPIADK